MKDNSFSGFLTEIELSPDNSSAQQHLCTAALLTAPRRACAVLHRVLASRAPGVSTPFEGEKG